MRSHIKSARPCTGLIARFAQQNALLLRTTAIRVGTEKKTPREQNSSGKKIGAVWCSGAAMRSFEASAVLHFVFFIVMVNKMQQSAKENCLLKRQTMPGGGLADMNKDVWKKSRGRRKWFMKIIS